MLWNTGLRNWCSRELCYTDLIFTVWVQRGSVCVCVWLSTTGLPNALWLPYHYHYWERKPQPQQKGTEDNKHINTITKTCHTHTITHRKDRHTDRPPLMSSQSELWLCSQLSHPFRKESYVCVCVCMPVCLAQMPKSVQRSLRKLPYVVCSCFASFPFHREEYVCVHDVKPLIG